MRVLAGVVLIAGLAGLAGCQSSSGGAAAPAPAPAPAVAAAAAAPVMTGDKISVCTAQAASRFGVDAGALSLSNEYPTDTGDAIDGAATLAEGFKRFRCDFTREGAFVAISDIPAADG